MKYSYLSMKNSRSLFIALVGVMAWLMLACDAKKANENNAEPENNAIDITFTPSDTSINLNLFYLNLKAIQLINVVVNDKAVPYSKITDESLALSPKAMRLGNNRVMFIYAQNKIIDTIQKDYFHTLSVAYSVQHTFKHHEQYFTEGLFFDDANNLVESMGLEGKSKIVFYKKNKNGYQSKDSILNENNEFGEGIALQDGNLVQLLWKNNYLKIFDYKSKKFLKNLAYPNEGWGLCTHQNQLYATNGSNVISVLDIKGSTTQIVKSIQVHDQHGPVANLNEIEYINGIIYANVWQSNMVCLINPLTGDVIGKIDFAALAEKEAEQNLSVDVINGIAFNKTNNTLLITGKYWRNFYEIKLETALPTL
jgi:glutamine cyclotransferase